MPTLEFVGQSSQDPDNVTANTSRLLNLYREEVAGRPQYVLKSVLGMQAFGEVADVFTRAMINVSGTVYAIVGGSFCRVGDNGSVTVLGTVPDGDNTAMSSNNGKVTIAAAGGYYVWDGSTLEQITNASLQARDAAYGFASTADISDVSFIGQRTVITFADRKVQWSEVADPTTFDALNFLTTETRDDNNLRSVEIGGALWVLKEKSTERLSQNSSGLAVVPNYTIDRGLKSYRLMVDVPQGVFFVGSDNRAYIGAAQGLGRPISNRAVETSIATQDATDCFYYTDEGHEFFVIRFQDRPAWAYDIASGEWHERAEGRKYGAWTAQQCVEAYGAHIVGTLTGGFHKLARTNADLDAPLRRRAVSKTLRMDGNRFVTRALEFLGSVGDHQLDLDAGETPRPPQIQLRVSRDYGRTWTDPKVRSMGALGDYDARVIFRGLGQARSLVVDVTLAAPVDISLDATATIEVA